MYNADQLTFVHSFAVYILFSHALSYLTLTVNLRGRLDRYSFSPLQAKRLRLREIPPCPLSILTYFSLQCVESTADFEII